ncbi:MAG TPA: CRISPR-associated endonuclease Cas2 [Candidatus Paceibacterota bacterium]
MAENYKAEYRSRVKEVVLATLAIGGLVAFAVMAPNAVQLLKYVIKDERQRRDRLTYLRRVINSLVDKEMIVKVKDAKGQTLLRITECGKKELKRYLAHDLKIKRPRHWDGKYHLIIFDIKETKRIVRDELRKWLEHLGFKRLQNSVWVYPYECREVVVLLKSQFKIGKDVLYITADEVENDGWLRVHFNLN